MDETKHTEIICLRSRYLVPFFFDTKSPETFNEINEQLSGEGIPNGSDEGKASSAGSWIRRESIATKGEDVAAADTYQLIQNLFLHSENESNLGCYYEYIGENRHPEMRYAHTVFNRRIPMHIGESGVFLFRTGIGFFWYEIVYPEDIQKMELICFQHDFRELAYTFGYSEPNKEQHMFLLNATEDTPFVMRRWIRDALTTLPVQPEYFLERMCPDENGVKQRCPDNALMFHYLALPESVPDEEFNELVFYLTNGYTPSFEIPKDFVDSIYAPFRNVRIYTSITGSGYYAKGHEDPDRLYDNAYFFGNIMKGRIMQDYFLLYVLALYEYYSLLYFSARISNELPADHRRYLEDSGQLLEQIRQLDTAISVFLVKSIYSSVSYIRMQNDYFNQLLTQLHIQENIESLNVGMESLQSLQQMRHQEELAEIEREENEIREKSDRTLNWVLGILSFFTVISALADLEGTLDALIGIFPGLERFHSELFLGSTAVIIIIFFYAFWRILHAFLGTKKGKKEERIKV